MKTCALPARLSVLPLALAAAFPAALCAETLQSDLPPVVVTASRVATPITDVIADVTVIERAALELAGQTPLRELLSRQPGVQLVANGSYRSATSVFLRGATNSQTIVLIDGVRVGAATSGGAPFENIPLERIERIEILRGAASALYGPDAVGGVIQIFTRDPADTLRLEAHAGAGSDRQRQAGVSVRGRAGLLGFSLGVSQEKADGISARTPASTTDYNPDKDGFSSTSVDAKLKAQLLQDHAVTLSLLRSRSEYRFDGRPSPNPLGLTRLTSDAIAQPELNHLALRWDARWLANWKSSLTLARSEDESVNVYHRSTDGAFGGSSKHNTERKQASWQNDFSVGRDMLSFALEKRAEQVDSSTNYTVKERDVRSALLSYALNRGDWDALAVLRHDDDSQFGGFRNWSLSGGYHLTQALRAVASMGTSFQAPTFNQLYWPSSGPGTYEGNPNLSPQRNRANELGLKYARDGVSLGAVAYHNDIQGFIAPATNVQSAQAVLRGATLTAGVQRNSSGYSLSYDYADPRTKPNDQRLARVARHMLNAQVDRQIGAVGLFGELRVSSDRQDGAATLGGYGLVNVGARWQIRKDLTLLARVNNLADKNYTLANTYSTPGRNAFVSLAWSL